MHQKIAAGLRTILTHEGGRSFDVPGPQTLVCFRNTPRLRTGPKGAPIPPDPAVFTIRWNWGENEEGSILAGVIHLVEKAGERLRGCVECGTPFLGVKRQIYCTKECAQRKRDRDKAERRETR
jgi:hypothetical protein